MSKTPSAGKRMRVKRDFTAFGMEVVKAYCIYPIQMRQGDLVEMRSVDALWGCSFTILAADSKAFAMERVEARDQWLADIPLARDGTINALLKDPGAGPQQVSTLEPGDVFEHAADAA